MSPLVDQIYHLASPASPPNYMYNPIKTLKTNTIGTLNMLGKLSFSCFLALAGNILDDYKHRTLNLLLEFDLGPLSSLIALPVVFGSFAVLFQCDFIYHQNMSWRRYSNFSCIIVIRLQHPGVGSPGSDHRRFM